MAGFHLNFSMVALYETRLSLVTFDFCDGGVVRETFFLYSDVPFKFLNGDQGAHTNDLEMMLLCYCTKACSYC